MGGGFTVTVITKKNAGQDILRSCFLCFGGDNDRILDNVLTTQHLPSSVIPGY